MPTTKVRYRFHLIQAFSLPETATYKLRSMSGTKEQALMNHQDVAHLLADTEWDLHLGALATHGDWPVETREEFMMVGANRLPLVRQACLANKYNGIVLLGGGDPGFMESREIGRRFGIPVTSCAHSQMHIATMLGSRFSIIDISETHNMRMQDLVVQYRFEDHCASIRNINFPLPRPPYEEQFQLQDQRDKGLRGERSEMLEAAIAESMVAIEEDGAEVLILGCSAAFWMRALIERRLREAGWDVPVLEGYSSAIEHLKLLVNLQLDASSLAFPVDHPKKWRRRKLVN